MPSVSFEEIQSGESESVVIIKHEKTAPVEATQSVGDQSHAEDRWVK